VRCKGCQVSHVLVPAECPPRSAYAIDVVGQALVAKALGAGHRSIAGRLDVPAATVRGWLRRAGRGAGQLRGRAEYSSGTQA
jgi:transposase-like protein